MWPYGWERVRGDSIKSNTVDPMEVQNEVRAGQRGCPLESKLRSRLKADGLSSRPGEGGGPEGWRGSDGGAGAAVVTGGRAQFKIWPPVAPLGIGLLHKYSWSSQYSWGCKESRPSPQGLAPPLPSPPLPSSPLSPPGFIFLCPERLQFPRLSAWPPHPLLSPPYSEISFSCSPSIP